MKTYIQPETKYVTVNAESLMDEEMQIISDPKESIDDPNQILSNENDTWEEETIAQPKSIWE